MSSPNDISGFQPITYDRRVQLLLQRSLVMMRIASFAVSGSLVKGSKVQRPRHGDVYVEDYVALTDATRQPIETEFEDLDIDQSRIVMFSLDKTEMVQSDFSVENKYARRSSYRLKNDMDGRFFDEVVNAQYSFDDGDIGGSPGSPLELSPTNVRQALTRAFARLRRNDVEEMGMASVFDPDSIAELDLAVQNNGFQLADSTIRNGFVGNYGGSEILMSNNLRTTVSLNIATNPSEDDTFTIEGVTFTFKASPASAGDIDIGGSAAVSVDNAVAAINGGAGAGSAYIELSTANRRIMINKRIVASDGTTSVDLVYSGRTSLATDLTDTTDAFGDQVVHSLIGIKRSIDGVIQINPNTEERLESRNLGRNYLSHTLHGFKTYTEGAEKLLDFQVKADAAVKA